MIELGLARISRLVQNLSMPWRAIHVAGTNGKGSVCSYASAMLTAANIKCGRFTSPHLIDRWDCITINERVVDQQLFHRVEESVRTRDQLEHIGASEFEVLTATAFEIFTMEKVQIAVVEVGIGGRNDATNVLRGPLVTVITKIGMDHESFLGNSLEAIAAQKAGIMKSGAPCVVDGTNSAKVIEVLRQNAEELGAPSLSIIPQDLSEEDRTFLSSNASHEALEEHQRLNLALAYEATRSAMKASNHRMEPKILSAALSRVWPGRLQRIDISKIRGQEAAILLDGAHNVSSAEVLACFVNRKLRLTEAPVTWILAFSRGKDSRQIISSLVKPQDNLVITTFGPVDGMPWVAPAPVADVLRTVNEVVTTRNTLACAEPVEYTLRKAFEMAEGGHVVVAGSLYLVSDVLRTLRDSA